jgi:hypothetical protein
LVAPSAAQFAHAKSEGESEEGTVERDEMGEGAGEDRERERGEQGGLQHFSG